MRGNLSRDLFGQDVREFCKQVDKAYFFRNLKPRILRAKESCKWLLPKRTTDPEVVKVYNTVLERCDEVLNTFRYGLEFMDLLIATDNDFAINRWCEVVEKLKSVYGFIESEENLLKRQCERLWRENFYNFIHGAYNGVTIPYVLVVAELPNYFWYKVATEPIVTTHVVTEKMISSLKENSGLLLYRVTQENLIDMSTSYRRYYDSRTDDKDNSFFFKIPELDKMFLSPDVNTYYSTNLRIYEEDSFLPPEIFVQKAKEKLSEKETAEQNGLGSILLKNDMKDLFGIFYSKDSNVEFKEKVRSFSQIFGTHIFEAKKDGTLEQVYQTGRIF